MCKSLMLAALLTAGITVQGQEVTISTMP